MIVRPEDRGQGLGAKLIDTVVNHPKLQAVESLGLCCLPEMELFYHRWGFNANGNIRILSRSQTQT